MLWGNFKLFLSPTIYKDKDLNEKIFFQDNYFKIIFFFNFNISDLLKPC